MTQEMKVKKYEVHLFEAKDGSKHLTVLKQDGEAKSIYQPFNNIGHINLGVEHTVGDLISFLENGEIKRTGDEKIVSDVKQDVVNSVKYFSKKELKQLEDLINVYKKYPTESDRIMNITEVDAAAEKFKKGECKK